MENESKKQNSRCPHCGAQMKEWWHALTPGLVNILTKAVQFVREHNCNRFHVHKELKLSHFEACNFQKLRLHGLVAHADPDSRRNGYWLITRRGGQFLRGEIAVPRRVKTYRNRVIGHSEDLIAMRDFRGKVPWFEQEFGWDIAIPEPAEMPKVEAPVLIPISVGFIYRFRSEAPREMRPATLFDYGKSQ